MKKAPIGISDFKELIENSYYYVDKSLFIKEIIDDGAKAILLPRPRRFGKTLNMSTLKYFFEKTDSNYYKERVIILIDEYDTAIQSGYLNGFYNEVIEFMRNFLSGALKDNVYLQKGVLTGILRVAKESIFSGLNNLKVYSMLNDRYSAIFGFLEDEVKEIL